MVHEGLLAIDANVYLPLNDADPNTPGGPANFFAAGNTLVNNQVPSLAAYIPAYKVVHVLDDDLSEFEIGMEET